ncbi:dna repair protein [Diplodia corticola]|uniref:Dna repair protein n=1 Tax=Diplodia corticola TaxID=236234 RepID=A0A1J9SEF6_9PEZI|nr:dna repair protein [Diplodia corticola]OJD37965.1 dna repair protein [Diplodia corticola]
MSAFVVPARSGAHRVAAIALYRALLTQCSPKASPSLPLADNQRAALRNVIRNKFRRNRHVHSAKHLKLSFTAGYELLDILDRASSTTPTTTTTTTPTSPPPPTPTSHHLLQTLLPLAPPHLLRFPPPPRGPRRLDPSPEACPPPARRLLARRPLPASALGGTGVRRVPRIVSANLFPMLRYRKPQPRSLSRVLTDKVKQRQRRLNVRREAETEWMAWGVGEDVWDRLVGVAVEEEEDEGVGRKRGRRGGDVVRDGEGEGDEASWTYEPQRIAKMISAQLGSQKRELVRTVKVMQDVVDKEAELAEAERKGRRAKKQRARRAKKRSEDVEATFGKEDGAGRRRTRRRPR